MSETKTTMRTPAIVPILTLRDGLRTVEWLCEAFGFAPTMVMAEGETVHHSELTLGQAMVMASSERREGGEYAPFAHPPGRAMLYVAIDGGLEEHVARARTAGAEIVLELRARDYGGADCTVRDPEGNLWTFGTYVPEVPL